MGSIPHTDEPPLKPERCEECGVLFAATRWGGVDESCCMKGWWTDWQWRWLCQSCADTIFTALEE